MTNIYQLPMQVPGMVGVYPNQKFMVVGDSLSALTTAGYLNQVNLESNPISTNDVLQVLYAYNPQTQVGTYGVFTVSIANGVISLVQSALVPSIYLGISTVSATLTQAQILGAYAAPALLVAAPGAGKVLVPKWATIYTNFQTAAFAGGGVAIVQYDTTVHGAGTNALAATIPAAEITAAASQIYNLAGSTAAALTGITNKGLYFSNATGAFTGGNAASTVVITLNYMTLAATV